MSTLVDNLRPDDRVAIVVYAGASGMVLDSTPAKNKRAILSALDRLKSGGGTNGGAGIKQAYWVAAQNYIRGGINRVIIGTDGDFNVGVTSHNALIKMVEEHARGDTGIALTVLGFGMGNYNDMTLEQLADKGDGNYAYIDTIQEARKVLVDQLDGTLTTIAKDVKIQVEFNPAQVAAYRLIGYENRTLAAQDFNDDTKDAGEIGAGHTVTALYEVVPTGRAPGVPLVDPLKYQPQRPAPRSSSELLTVKLRYKAPTGGPSTLIEQPVIDGGKTFEDASTDLRFAASVAAFGMLLRGSPNAGNATMSTVLSWAENAIGKDEWGYRQGFLELVRRAARRYR
jgi:Ca-activated chloride channel family protein